MDSSTISMISVLDGLHYWQRPLEKLCNDLETCLAQVLRPLSTGKAH